MSRKEDYNLHEKLHTEVLEEKYGQISLQVLHDDDEVREVLLTDQHDIARTYAITLKSYSWRHNSEICAVNDAIRGGEPIGIAFKDRGFAIKKNVLAVYTIELPEWLQHAFVVEENFAKTRITEFVIEKQGQVFQYGYVTEMYSPDFRKPVISATDKAQISCPPVNQWRVKALKQKVNTMLSEIAPVLLFF
jgi:hypothetical protein